MPYFKFRDNDLFVNTIEAYPDVKFYIQSGSVYINDRAFISGTMPGTPNATSEIGVPRNYISLYEYNVNRGDQGSIYPFVVKDGQKTTFKSISKVDWNTQFNYGGNQITSSYNLSSSISRYRMSVTPGGATPNPGYPKMLALQNSINHYRFLSPYYNYEEYYKGKVINLISIPSIFYGSAIRKGSVNLKFYISGSLIAQASDTKYNGELIQVSGTTTGDVAGIVLYKEGIIILTGSTVLNTEGIWYNPQVGGYPNAIISPPYAVPIDLVTFWIYACDTTAYFLIGILRN